MESELSRSFCLGDWEGRGKVVIGAAHAWIASFGERKRC